ncbi:MAG TPA: hypothetical protein VGF45_05110 [Polyangia bacterium]
MASKTNHPPSEVLAAAEAFDEELATYASVSGAFARAQLTSSKHIEKAKDALNQIAASEERLAACGARLAAAVNAARNQQEALAKGTLERVPMLQQRMEQLRGLVGQFEALGKEAGALNGGALAIVRWTPEQGDRDAQLDRARALLTEMHSLSQRAQELSTQAREAEFEELAVQAHALHQQLQAAHNKLRLAVNPN